MPLFDEPIIILPNTNQFPPINPNAVYGTSGNDVIGLSQPKLVFAGGGNDVVFGSAGNDTIYGGTGDDIIVGAAGDDKLYGDSGNDRLYAGLGSDSMFGGAGNDRLYVDPGDNTNAFADLASGGSGIDTLILTNANAGSLRLFSAEGVSDQILYWTETTNGQVINQSIIINSVEFVELGPSTIIAVDTIQSV